MINLHDVFVGVGNHHVKILALPSPDIVIILQTVLYVLMSSSNYVQQVVILSSQPNNCAKHYGILVKLQVMSVPSKY
jgi:hypothetical protein